MPTACSEMVTLKGGLTVSLDALRIGWSLEQRGFRLEPVGGRLRVAPHDALTPDDVVAIKAHRDELLALVQSEPRPEVQ